MHRPRGRPRLSATVAKRHSVGIRTTKEIKDLLQSAADSSGRSLAQEIELRLIRSFWADDSLDAWFDATCGDPRNAGVMLMLGRILRDASVFAGVLGRPDWLDDGGEFEAVKQAIIRTLDGLRPNEPGEDSEHVARFALIALAAGSRDPKIRKRLGEAVAKRLDELE